MNPEAMTGTEAPMRVKLFTRGKGLDPHKRFEDLEQDINSWLAEHPEARVAFAHRLSQPTFGWGELGLALWYEDV